MIDLRVDGLADSFFHRRRGERSIYLRFCGSFIKLCCVTMLTIMLVRTARRGLMRGGHVFIMRTSMAGMVIVFQRGVVLMFRNGRCFCDHAGANAVASTEQDRQRGKEGRPKNACDHVLTNLSKATIYTPKGYMSTMGSHV